MRAYAYSNLSAALRDSASPLRRYLQERFGDVRALQADYCRACGALLVPGGSADAATVGSAFDLALRFTLDPSYPADIAVVAFARDPRLLAAADDVTRVAGACAAAGDDDGLARCAWALALCTAVYREGLRPDTAVASLVRAGRFTSANLRALAPADAVRQVLALLDVARERLLPSIPPGRPLALGPRFAASALCAADADLVTDGRLLEIKTRLGAVVPRTGARRDRLTRADVFQLLSYALFDRPDAYAIDTIGVYSARYGLLVTWPLDRALSTLAGHPVDLPGAREDVWRLLGGR